jgi:hypothetical protein
MDGRSAWVLSLVLSACTVSDGRATGPATPLSGGPADNPGGGTGDAGDETGDGESTGGHGSSSTDDEGTTSGEAESGSQGEASGGDEIPAGHCDPLSLDACPEHEVCVFVQAYFRCFADASGPIGATGDSCQFENVCDPGLFCSLDVPCSDGVIGCCTPFCDLTAADPCTAGSCVPYFPDGSPFPWLEDLGYCDGV